MELSDMKAAREHARLEHESQIKFLQQEIEINRAQLATRLSLIDGLYSEYDGILQAMTNPPPSPEFVEGSSRDAHPAPSSPVRTSDPPVIEEDEFDSIEKIFAVLEKGEDASFEDDGKEVGEGENPENAS
jgi:hypothetical protein